MSACVFVRPRHCKTPTSGGQRKLLVKGLFLARNVTIFSSHFSLMVFFLSLKKLVFVFHHTVEHPTVSQPTLDNAGVSHNPTPTLNPPPLLKTPLTIITIFFK